MITLKCVQTQARFMFQPEETMADYERFGSSDEKSSSVMPEVSENEVAEINDAQIKTDKANETGLTIYDTETKENLEYIDDPSKVIPKTFFE